MHLALLQQLFKAGLGEKTKGLGQNAQPLEVALKRRKQKALEVSRTMLAANFVLRKRPENVG